MIWAGRVFAVILAAVGVILATGGIYLLSFGGSAYYAIAGLLVLASAWLAWRRSPQAGVVYAAMLVASLLWALFESGLDRWGLSARLLAPAVLGLWLLLPMKGAKPPLLKAARIVPPAVMLFVMAVVLAGPRIDTPLPYPAAGAADAAAPGEEWRFWGGDAGGARYSALDQINAGNVGKLELAWTHELPKPADHKLSNMEITPLKVGDNLYVCNHSSVVQALDPATGKPRWTFDPGIKLKDLPMTRTCRGVAYYKVPEATGHCAERILAAAVDAGLWAIDAHDGKPCAAFGDKGRVDLAIGMGPIGGGYFYTSSAPTIIRGKAVLGGWVTDNQKVGSPPGVIRAYDVVTGQFAWAFDIGKPDFHGQPAPGQTYTLGTPNAWAPMAADEKLGMIYIPTGNAGPDDFGGQRSPQADRLASSVLALAGDTGALRWSFQTVHHDLWDYDVPSQPTLVDLPGGRPALLQASKAGRVFLLDRRTGEPLSRVVEMPVPQSKVPGERSSPTQPIAIDLPQFDGPRLTERLMWGVTPIDQLLCRIRFRKADYQGPYTPPGLGRESISWPGFMGSMSWGSLAVDRQHGVFVVNTSHVATVAQLVPRAEADRMGLKAKGDPKFKPVKGYYAQAGTPYALRMEAFLSPLGIPCQQPPYGLITAVDYQHQKLLWQRLLGTSRDSGPLGFRLGLGLPMGVPNIGGAIVTRSGLVFISATQEETFRAIDIRTGKIMWQAPLPAGGQATPMTYRGADGRQYVVLAAGGKGLLQTRLGNSIVAYALPKGMR